MALVLPGTIFREEFKKRRIAPQMLSRQMEDTATITSPLVPWNTCGAYMAATLGVATAAYLPYCFFKHHQPCAVVYLRCDRVPDQTAYG